MTIDVAVFALGACLLLYALSGGGFELKGLFAPSLSPVARVSMGLIGGAFILIGIQLSASGAPAPPSTSISAENADKSQEIRAVIRNQLGDGQISEKVTISIDGRSIGELVVDIIHPSSALALTLPKSGQYSYRAVSTTIELGSDGEAAQINGTGNGYIEVRPGIIFELNADEDQGMYRISLQEFTGT